SIRGAIRATTSGSGSHWSGGRPAAWSKRRGARTPPATRRQRRRGPPRPADQAPPPRARAPAAPGGGPPARWSRPRAAPPTPAAGGGARRTLEEYHRAHPLRAGMPREELKSRLGLAPAAFGAALTELARDGVLADRAGELALPAHKVEIDPAAGGPAGRLLEIL